MQQNIFDQDVINEKEIQEYKNNVIEYQEALSKKELLEKELRDNKKVVSFNLIWYILYISAIIAGYFLLISFFYYLAIGWVYIIAFPKTLLSYVWLLILCSFFVYFYFEKVSQKVDNLIIIIRKYYDISFEIIKNVITLGQYSKINKYTFSLNQNCIY